MKVYNSMINNYNYWFAKDKMIALIELELLEWIYEKSLSIISKDWLFNGGDCKTVHKK